MNYRRTYEPLPSNDDIFEAIEKEQAHIGYYKLPFQDTTEFKEYASTIKQKYIAVIGIGGSTLGSYAIYSFLKESKHFEKELVFFESTDPLDISSKLHQIELDDTLFVVISKSGTTIETVTIFKYINSLVKIDNGNCLVITENDSKLNTYAQAHNIKTFEIPKDVGGRFSVLSSVGLAPLAIVGVDIDELLSGAGEIYNSFFNKDEFFDDLLAKARFFAENKDKYNINVLFSYSQKLEGFNKWYVQLWGESLGKIDVNGANAGLTPICLIGPVDQHSFLQLIMEGKRDKSVTFIKIGQFNKDIEIPHITLEGLEELDYVGGVKFSDLINMQASATIESIEELKDIPLDVIEIDVVDERNIGRLMFYYELLTSLCARFIHINAYDQPGVEKGKIILKAKFK